MGLIVQEMIQKHNLAIVMAAQVILNDIIARCPIHNFYYTKLIVPGVAGVLGIPALQPAVVAIKEETELLFRRH